MQLDLTVHKLLESGYTLPDILEQLAEECYDRQEGIMGKAGQEVQYKQWGLAGYKIDCLAHDKDLDFNVVRNGG